MSVFDDEPTMVLRIPRRRRRPIGCICGPRTKHPHLEPLERRMLLSGTSGDSTASSDDLADAYQAAMIDFNGPDLVGKDGPMARIGFDLTLLFDEYEVHTARHPGTAFTPSSGSRLQVNGDLVTVDLFGTGDLNAFETQLTDLGMQNIAVAGSLISGDIALSSLDELAGVPSLNFARPSYRPVTSVGLVTSQGDSALQAELSRTEFGVDGSGVTVGLLSDSFDAASQFVFGSNLATQQDIASGDLPANTQILDDYPFGADEGRGMAQLVHDIAPGAAIQFATASRSESSFANNIRRLADAGSDVIVDDVVYLTEPYYQDGVVAQAASSVVANGIPYFSSAGNFGDEAYESAFVSSSQFGGLFGSLLHDFDPGPGIATLQQFDIPLGGVATIGFQWDQPFRSLGGLGSASDVDIFLVGADGTTVVAGSFAINFGGDPLELFQFVNDGSFDLDSDGIPDTNFFIQIELFSGPPPGLMKYISYGDGTIVTFDTNSATSVGHANAAGVIGVGASVYLATPAFNVDPPRLNEFSSKGGTPILFDVSGNRLAAPIDRMSPQITSVDGTNTTFFGQDIPQDVDAFPNFFGTSAAAPHAAAVAALMIQSTGGPGSITPQRVYEAMEATAIDIVSRIDVFGIQQTTSFIPNGTGFDRYSGYGLIDAAAALQYLSSGITINDVAEFEGDSGLTDFVFTVSFVGAIHTPVAVAYTTLDGTATATNDYLTAKGTVTFVPGGGNKKSITVQVVGELAVELNETFKLSIDPANAPVIRSTGIGTILNDDVELSINDISVVEGNTGTKNAVFTVLAAGTVNRVVSVLYATSEGTAQGGVDFQPRTDTAIINPGASQTTIVVPIINDTFNEANEQFFVLLANPANARILDGVGIATIIDNDLLPSFYVNDVFITTIGPSLEAAVFTVALDSRSGRNVTVHYTTVDDTALAGQSYVAQSGDLTFVPGVSNLQVTVPIMPSAVYAPNERFSLDLSAPTNATINDGHGIATIIFAQPSPTQFIVDDGDAAFTSTGSWTNVTNLTAYQLDYSYHAPGNGNGTATWSYVGIPNGTYQIFTRWSAFSNRATNAPYTIYDALGSLATVRVNQQLPPTGDQVGDITWQSLGTFEIVNRTLRVELTNAANGYVIADAMRVVSGNAVPQAPEIDVSGFERSIADGDTSPSLPDSTDFGSTPPNSTDVTRTFTIYNSGNADLHLTGSPRVQISGPQAFEFAVTREPDSTIPPGGSTSFDVKFAPTTTGLRQATISIANDDASESLYDFAIAGTGGTPIVPLAHNATMPTDVNGDSLVSPVDALLVINELVRSSAAGSDESSVAPAAATSESEQQQYYLDVDDDGQVSPHDALLVINQLLSPTTAASTASGDESGSVTPAAMVAVAVDIAIGDPEVADEADGTVMLDFNTAMDLAVRHDEADVDAALMTSPVSSVIDAERGDDEADSLLAALDE